MDSMSNVAIAVLMVSSLVGLFSLDISRPLQLTVKGGESEIEDVLRDINEFMQY